VLAAYRGVETDAIRAGKAHIDTLKDLLREAGGGE
jgi:hypothetical protein